LEKSQSLIKKKIFFKIANESIQTFMCNESLCSQSQTVIGYKLLNAAKIHCNNIQTHLQSRWTHMTQI